jgi:DNA-binding GntR family transcriptional regulator
MSTSETIYKIERQSLAEQVYNYIKRLILSGDLKGGEKIPEEKVAQQFGVSRTPIREALRRLEEYGLIKIKPRSFAEVVKLDPQEAEQLARVRARLETLAVEVLAECGVEEDFAILEHLAKECEALLATGDLASTFEKDSQFHLEIAKRTGNQHLYEIFEKIDAKMQLLRLVLHLPVKELTQFIGQHEPLVHHMKVHDKEAAVRLMTKHVLDQLEHFERREAC